MGHKAGCPHALGLSMRGGTVEDGIVPTKSHSHATDRMFEVKRLTARHFRLNAMSIDSNDRLTDCSLMLAYTGT